MAVLDTATLVDLTRRTGRSEAAARLVSSVREDGAQLCTTRFNVAELLAGVELAPRKDRERRIVERILAGVPVLEFDDRAAQRFAVVFAVLRRAGTPIGDMDSLIASVALAHGYSIITPNAEHFRRVPGLRVLSY